jgi:uncharacterized protein YukE
MNVQVDGNGVMRWVMSGVQIILLAALTWNISTLLDLREKAAANSVVLQNMQTNISSLQADRWTGTDQSRYSTEQERRWNDVLRRLESIERRSR